MEGFGEKSYENMIASIEKSRQTNLVRVLYSLGISGIGLANAKVLCKEFHYNMEKIMNTTTEELEAIDGIGPILAKGFVEYFSNEHNRQVVEHLLEKLHLEEVEESKTEKIFEGKTFVITGSVEHFKNRNEMKAYIEERGGKVTGSVTAKTDVLVNNDITSSSSKNKKAKELGIPIWSEEQVLRGRVEKCQYEYKMIYQHEQY